MSGVGADTLDIARGVLVNFAGGLLKSVSVLFYVWLARTHGATVTGVFVLCQASLDIASKLGLLGFDRGVLTFAARHRATGDEEGVYRSIAQALTVTALCSLVLVALLEAVVPALCQVLRRSDLVDPLRIMTPGILFWVLTAVLVHAARAVRVMKHEIAVKSVVEPVTLFACAFLLRPHLPGVEGLAWSFLIATAAGTTAAAVLFGRLYALRRVARLLLAREGRAAFTRFSSFIGVYDLLNLLLQRVDLLLLSRFGSPAAVGVYGLAQNAAFTFKKVRQSFDPITIPVLAAAGARARPDELLGHFRTVTRWVLVINLALLGVAAFGSRLIMGIFGQDFTAGAVPLVLLTVAVLLNTVLGVSELFILIERPALNLLNTVVAIVVAAGLGLLLIPRHGMTGAAVTALGAYLVMNLLRLLMVRVLYHMQPFTGHHARAVLAAVGAGAGTALLKGPLHGLPQAGADLFAVAAFLAGYALLLRFLGLAPEDRALLGRIAARISGRRVAGL